MITLSAIRNAKILIVDDLEANVMLLEHMLASAGYLSVSSVLDSREVVELHRTHSYDLILLDLNMPFMNGFQVLEALKQIETGGYLPVLVLTAEPAHKLRALEAGAKDFISKPFDYIEVLTRIQNMLEVRLLYKETKDYDALTGLPNRMLFHESLKRALRHAQDEEARLAVFLIDLDRFNSINDTMGHPVGDELLRQFSHRLLECIGIHDTVGRLGGDEFALFVKVSKDQNDATTLANEIRNALRPVFHVLEHEIIVSASIGITVYPDDAADVETLLRYADTAMYRAKEAGRDTYSFFTSEMNERVQRRLDLENALRKAIVQQEFVLYYQPKVDIRSGRISGAEALIRWNRPGHGVVSPTQFIPALEETGLIVSVGAWVISAACKQINAWTKSATGPIHVAVNISRRQFFDGELEMVVANAIAENGIEQGLLELEITESALMVNVEQAVTILRNLKAKGLHISIDDFGTGYSSLAYLKRFPIDTLKIDIAFVREVTSNPDDAAITLAIIRMAHSLKMNVIAEGVETAGQLAYLSRNRCDQIQGYYFSPPVPALEFEQMVRDQKTLAAPSYGTGMPPRSLLIVDNDRQELAALQRLLLPDAYRILTASSVAEGFALLAMNQVQLVLCEQDLPDMCGTDFLNKIQDIYPDIFRIVLTDAAKLPSIIATVNSGSLYRFYTRPWDSQTMRNNIRAAFRHYSQLHGMAQDEEDSVGGPLQASNGRQPAEPSTPSH